MSLLKKTEIDKVEIVKTGDWSVIQVRTATWIEEDGKVIGSKGYHRHVVSPTDDLSNESDEVTAIANAVFTQEMKDAYTASQESAE